MARASGIITMSMPEVDRLKKLQAVADGNMPGAVATNRLGLSKWQVNRLLVRLRAEGASGVVSRQRGKRGHRQLLPGVASLALSLIRERCSDFGQTLACEKLREVHGLVLAKETVRKLINELFRVATHHIPALHEMTPQAIPRLPVVATGKRAHVFLGKQFREQVMRLCKPVAFSVSKVNRYGRGLSGVLAFQPCPQPPRIVVFGNSAWLPVPCPASHPDFPDQAGVTEIRREKQQAGHAVRMRGCKTRCPKAAE